MTKKELECALEDRDNMIAGLEAEIERLEHSRRCLRGQLVKSGQEIVRLRREKRLWSAKAEIHLRTQLRHYHRVLEAQQILWLVAGIDDGDARRSTRAASVRKRAQGWLLNGGDEWGA